MKALIFGITGQDGSYLAEFLLAQGYEVHGVKRRASSFNTDRINHVWDRIHLHYGDVTDACAVKAVIHQVRPDEIYHLAAMSHVAVSFELPAYTMDCIVKGTLHIYEAARTLFPSPRIYHASTSEMFGASPPPQNEQTPFQPQSPYAVAKVAAHQLGRVYRESYGMFICNGILFNHTSPRRGETFVLRKIARGVAALRRNPQAVLRLGNLNARRDFGHAADYVRAMWMLLQQGTPRDMVVASDQCITIREAVSRMFAHAGYPLTWEGDGLDEVGRYEGRILVRVDPQYYRPLEVDALQGDATQIRETLGWQPQHTLTTILHELVDHELSQTLGEL